MFDLLTVRDLANLPGLKYDFLMLYIGLYLKIQLNYRQDGKDVILNTIITQLSCHEYNHLWNVGRLREVFQNCIYDVAGVHAKYAYLSELVNRKPVQMAIEYVPKIATKQLTSNIQASQ